jgi:hypothetical protein
LVGSSRVDGKRGLYASCSGSGYDDPKLASDIVLDVVTASR